MPQRATHQGWDPLVVELFDHAKRDAAIKALIAQDKFESEPPYREDSVGEVKEVVLVPQPTGLPWVVVFLKTSYGDADALPRSGHFVVVRADGTLIPVRGNANSLGGYFGDLDADGIPELVEAHLSVFRSVTATVLRARSVTEGFPDRLTILWKPDLLSWRLVHDEASKLPNLELFSPKDKRAKTVARYRWSVSTNAWEGPRGSAKDGFFFVPAEEDGDLKALAVVGNPDCRTLVDTIAWSLPKVRKVFDEAGPDARPGGLENSIDPGEIDFSLGFHHDDRFESVFFVSVTDGKLEVSGAAGPLEIPVALQKEAAAACKPRK